MCVNDTTIISGGVSIHKYALNVSCRACISTTALLFQSAFGRVSKIVQTCFNSLTQSGEVCSDMLAIVGRDKMVNVFLFFIFS